MYLSRKIFRSVIVFCSRKQQVKQLSQELKRSGFSIEEIHSDLEQAKREQVLLDFKNKKLKILVATDILSRGIDVEDIDLVINYDVPNDGEDYIHRIGRTARAQTDGTAYTFISEKEQNKFSRIEELLGKPVDKTQVPEQFGETPAYHPRSSSGAGKGKRNLTIVEAGQEDSYNINVNIDRQKSKKNIQYQHSIFNFQLRTFWFFGLR
jgi:superfamily II DNA/RNA helicase